MSAERSVDYTLNNPQDPFVTRKLEKGDHGRIMDQISAEISAPDFKRLAQEFCISLTDIGNIEYNNRNSDPWHTLNGIVDTWLKGNTEVYDKGARANERWLVEAVRKINKAYGTTLAAKYGIPELSDSTHNAKETKGNTTAKTAVKTNDKGLEETDSGPPDVEKYCPALANKIRVVDYQEDLTKDINIIIVTATDTEYQAVMGQAKPMEDDEKYIQTRTNGITFNVAMYGRYKVVIIETGQGVENTSKKLQKIQEVVKAQYVIAIGVCYGIREGKKETKLGSILVPKRVKIISTHTHRDDEDVLKTEDRNSGDTLYDIFENFHGFALDDKNEASIKTGDDILVTEDSLVTSQKRKSLIEDKVSQALGGEMEAAAILQKGVKFEGIVVKAIADWGDMDKASCAPSKGFSAYAAAKYVWYQLSSIPKDELKTN